MNRRDFMKGALLTASMLSSGKAFAGGFDRKNNFKRLSNRGNPSVLEQKHVPGIEAPDSVNAGYMV